MTQPRRDNSMAHPLGAAAPAQFVLDQLSAIWDGLVPGTHLQGQFSQAVRAIRRDGVTGYDYVERATAKDRAVDEYIVDSLFAATAYALQAIDAAQEGDRRDAWEWACASQFWYGLLLGMKGLLSAEFADILLDFRTAIPRAGAAATNKRHSEARRTVFSWLDGNYGAWKERGARHTDMAATLEKLVEREHETILKDITTWKKKRMR